MTPVNDPHHTGQAPARPDDFAPSEHLQSEVRYIGAEQQPVLVVDDYLADPESMVRYAADEAAFGPAPNMYPGVVAQVPNHYVDGLRARLAPLLGEVFALDAAAFRPLNNFLGIVTTNRTALKDLQRLPHVDGCRPGQIAILLYLCEGSQGGTAFYRFRTTGWETVDSEQFAEVQRQVKRSLSMSPLPADYITGDNELYEQIGRVDARFNRLVAYRSRAFHSGLIGPQTTLDPRPRVRRLTVNSFVHLGPR